MLSSVCCKCFLTRQLAHSCQPHLARCCHPHGCCSSESSVGHCWTSRRSSKSSATCPWRLKGLLVHSPATRPVPDPSVVDEKLADKLRAVADGKMSLIDLAQDESFGNMAATNLAQFARQRENMDEEQRDLLDKRAQNLVADAYRHEEANAPKPYIPENVDPSKATWPGGPHLGVERKSSFLPRLDPDA